MALGLEDLPKLKILNRSSETTRLHEGHHKEQGLGRWCPTTRQLTTNCPMSYFHSSRPVDSIWLQNTVKRVQGYIVSL